MKPTCLIAAALLLGGCGTFQPTAGQRDSFSTRQRGYRLTAEELAAIPVLLDERTVEHLDAEGRVTRREIASIQRGYPTATQETQTTTSDAFTDSAMGLEQDANNAGTRVRLDRTTQGNADTLGLTTAAQTQRAQIDAQLLERMWQSGVMVGQSSIISSALRRAGPDSALGPVSFGAVTPFGFQLDPINEVQAGAMADNNRRREELARTQAEAERLREELAAAREEAESARKALEAATRPPAPAPESTDASRPRLTLEPLNYTGPQPIHPWEASPQ